MPRFILAACLCLALRAANAADSHVPPMTRTGDHVDDYHGEKVADPYRWLEDDVRTSKEVADWVSVENDYTAKFLESIPQRDDIKARLTKLFDFEKFDVPFKEGGRYYFFKNDGLQNQF